MVTIVDIVKNGKRILGYNCLEDNRVIFLTKDEVVEEIRNNNCLNGKVQEYKGSIIVRVLGDTNNSSNKSVIDNLKVIDLETMPLIDSFNTVTKPLNPFYKFQR